MVSFRHPSSFVSIQNINGCIIEWLWNGTKRKKKRGKKTIGSLAVVQLASRVAPLWGVHTFAVKSWWARVVIGVNISWRRRRRRRGEGGGADSQGSGCFSCSGTHASGGEEAKLCGGEAATCDTRARRMMKVNLTWGRLCCVALLVFPLLVCRLVGWCSGEPSRREEEIRKWKRGGNSHLQPH